MRDFTLRAYTEYVRAIISSQSDILRFDEYFSSSNKPDRFCIIRHDVDRKPRNALMMARIESELGVSATYFFRAKPHTFIADIMKTINQLGHEVGYHYENLSDTDGDIDHALADFGKNLGRLRDVVPIRTIAMHGKPLKPFDNRDLWKHSSHRSLLRSRFDILGEVYLDIDYADIAYINDTGRNWTSGEANLRDKVKSFVHADFKNGDELLDRLRGQPYPKMIFQVHPERWTDNLPEWCIQLCKDKTVNVVKHFLSLLRKQRSRQGSV